MCGKCTLLVWLETSARHPVRREHGMTEMPDKNQLRTRSSTQRLQLGSLNDLDVDRQQMLKYVAVIDQTE